MSLNARISGEEELLRNIKKASKEMKAIIATELIKGALVVEKDAKKKCPVLTDRLRSSLTHSEPREIKKKLIAKVGTITDYAPYVEHGTSRQRAQPYLGPALKKNKRQIHNRITKAIKKYTGKKKI